MIWSFFFVGVSGLRVSGTTHPCRWEVGGPGAAKILGKKIIWIFIYSNNNWCVFVIHVTFGPLFKHISFAVKQHTDQHFIPSEPKKTSPKPHVAGLDFWTVLRSALQKWEPLNRNFKIYWVQNLPFLRFRRQPSLKFWFFFGNLGNNATTFAAQHGQSSPEIKEWVTFFAPAFLLVKHLWFVSQKNSRPRAQEYFFSFEKVLGRNAFYFEWRVFPKQQKRLKTDFVRFLCVGWPLGNSVEFLVFSMNQNRFYTPPQFNLYICFLLTDLCPIR